MTIYTVLSIHGNSIMKGPFSYIERSKAERKMKQLKKSGEKGIKLFSSKLNSDDWHESFCISTEED